MREEEAQFIAPRGSFIGEEEEEREVSLGHQLRKSRERKRKVVMERHQLRPFHTSQSTVNCIKNSAIYA